MEARLGRPSATISEKAPKTQAINPNSVHDGWVRWETSVLAYLAKRTENNIRPSIVDGQKNPHSMW